MNICAGAMTRRALAAPSPGRVVVEGFDGENLDDAAVVEWSSSAEPTTKRRFSMPREAAVARAIIWSLTSTPRTRLARPGQRYRCHRHAAEIECGVAGQAHALDGLPGDGSVVLLHLFATAIGAHRLNSSRSAGCWTGSSKHSMQSYNAGASPQMRHIEVSGEAEPWCNLGNLHEPE